MTTSFYAPYFEPYAYSEPYPWVAGPEFGYESDEMVGSIRFGSRIRLPWVRRSSLRRSSAF